MRGHPTLTTACWQPGGTPAPRPPPPGRRTRCTAAGRPPANRAVRRRLGPRRPAAYSWPQAERAPGGAHTGSVLGSGPVLQPRAADSGGQERPWAPFAWLVMCAVLMRTVHPVALRPLGCRPAGNNRMCFLGPSDPPCPPSAPAPASLPLQAPYPRHLPWLFFGEELLQLLRMWQAGWDVFTPSETVAFHRWWVGRVRDGVERVCGWLLTEAKAG